MKLFTLGGYSVIGKNMTAVQVGDEIVVIDMGFYLPPLLAYEGDQNDLDKKTLSLLGILPEDKILYPLHKKVKAIVIGHAHLDHVGALPYLAAHYDCPIIGTPYTIEYIKNLYASKRVECKNKLIAVEPDGVYKISPTLKVQLVNVTHSILQAALVVLHSPEGQFVYTNDFKFDETPVLGKVTSYHLLEKLTNVQALVVDSCYAFWDGITPSEQVAAEMLEDVLLSIHKNYNLLVVTTFSSHLPRIKSILAVAKKLKRKVVIMGRSLNSFISAGERLDLVNFSKQAEIVFGTRQCAQKFKEIEQEGRGNYLLVCTGNQGEPDAMLSKIAHKKVDFTLTKGDAVIFSCNVIPTDVNRKCREHLEDKLKRLGTAIFTEVHQSGHGRGGDIKRLISLVRPKYIISAHGSSKGAKAVKELVEKNHIPAQVLPAKDGEFLEI